MAIALETLGPAACERIVRELVTVHDNRSAGRRLCIACPWHDERTPGACWYDQERDRAVCYSCNHFGDLADIFCAVGGYAEGSREGLAAFLAAYAPQAARPASSGGSGAKRERPPLPAFSGRDAAPPTATWAEGCGEWLRQCAQALTPERLERLRRWGLSEATARACAVGYNDRDRFVPFTRWGLPYAENKNGRERCIVLPEGYVFPAFRARQLQRVKIRAEHPREGEPRYRAVVGGDPAGYAVFGAASWKVWYVVETERDGMALWERLAPYGIGVMATGSAAMPPDARAYALLAASDCVVVALDNDAAGRAASWRFLADPSRFAWDGTYPQAVRWLVPCEAGKDAGDLAALEAAGAPLSLREWALAGLPADQAAWARAALRPARSCSGGAGVFSGVTGISSTAGCGRRRRL